MKVLYVKNVLDVVFMDNSRVTITDATDDLYNQLLQLHDKEEEAMKLLSPYFQEKIEAYEEAINFDKKVTQYPELAKYGDIYTFHKISDISVPKSVIEAFIAAKEAHDDLRVESILNFWINACGVQDSRVRNNIFWYCEKYGIKISRYGQLVLYRNAKLFKKGTTVEQKVPVQQEVVEEKIPAAVPETETKEVGLTEFISNEFIRVKTKMKKNTAHFSVIFKDGVLMVSSNPKVIAEATTNYGILKDLYLGLAKEVAETPESEEPVTEKVASEPQPKEETPVAEIIPDIYTDAHSGTTRIQIAKMVMLDRKQCDTNQNNTCSKGLHSASKQWLENQGANYFGSGISLLVLVNPSDIVAIPPVDGYGKLRSCAYLPVKVLQWENGKIIDDTYEDIIEGEFYKNIVDESKVTVADSESEEYKFVIPNVPDVKNKTYSKSLNDLKAKILGKNLK